MPRPRLPPHHLQLHFLRPRQLFVDSHVDAASLRQAEEGGVVLKLNVQWLFQTEREVALL